MYVRPRIWEAKPLKMSASTESTILSTHLRATCRTLKHQCFMLLSFLSTEELLCFLSSAHFSQHKWILCPLGVQSSFRYVKGRTGLYLGEPCGMWQLVLSGASDGGHSEQFRPRSAAAQTLRSIPLRPPFSVPGAALHEGRSKERRDRLYTS